MLGAKRIIKPPAGMCFYLPAQYSLNPRRHQHSDRNLPVLLIIAAILLAVIIGWRIWKCIRGGMGKW